MKNIFVLWNLAAAVTIAVLITGCGSSGLTVPLERHLSETDSLQREITNLKSKDGALNARVASLENEKRLALTQIAELESTVTFLKGQIGKSPVAPSAAPTEAQPGVSESGNGYEQALGLFRERQYAQAAQAFQSLIDRGIDLKLQDNCRYWLGECLFGSKEYTKAIEDFRQVFSYEKSEKKDESQMMIARSYAAMGNAAQAKAEYQKLIDTFPASPYRKKAEIQIARFK